MRALPRQLVTELLMCGERISSPRLFELGLVNRVTASGHALTEALTLAGQLNARAPNALSSIKTLMNEASHSTLTEQLDRERDHFVRNLHHANAGIGISAFLNKETPVFE
jgi:enoyl-CoA hydratase/carnithine racemase